MTDAHSCIVAVTLRQVVTSVEPRGAARHTRMTFPSGCWFTLDAIAQMFGVTRGTVYTTLCVHRAKLGRPTYRQRRRNGDFRLRRIVSEHDVDVLCTIFRVVVNGKNAFPC